MIVLTLLFLSLACGFSRMINATQLSPWKSKVLKALGIAIPYRHATDTNPVLEGDTYMLHVAVRSFQMLSMHGYKQQLFQRGESGAGAG